jgi:hypothetical protein
MASACSDTSNGLTERHTSASTSAAPSISDMITSASLRLTSGASNTLRFWPSTVELNTSRSARSKQPKLWLTSLSQWVRTVSAPSSALATATSSSTRRT